MSKGGGRHLGPGLHGFDEIEVGDLIETGREVVTAEVIDAFAGLTGDRFEIHMDEDAAARHGFDGRVAHGLLVLSLVDGLKNRAPAQFRARASLGWEWRFAGPVLAGDEIRATIRVAAKRATSKPDLGILTLGFEVRNQRDETVQDGENRLMVWR